MPHSAKCWFSGRSQLAYCSAIAVSLALSACVAEQNELTIPLGAGAGSSVTQPQRTVSQPGQSQVTPAPGVYPMMQDPEAHSQEWTAEVRANSSSEAEQLCKRMAEKYSLTTLLKATQLTKTPDKNGKVKFVCWFKSEIIGGTYGDDKSRSGN